MARIDYAKNDAVIEELKRDKETARITLLGSFILFIKVFHWYIYRSSFQFKSFHYKLAEKLSDIVFLKNEKRNLYIGMPPRYGKSQMMIYFVAYCYAIAKKSNFIITSYGADLVGKFSSEIRDIIQSDLYNSLFNVQLSQDTTSKELWKINRGGSFRAVTLGGVITGFGAGVLEDGVFGGAIIIDDFMKALDYNSKAQKRMVIEAYENTLKTRKNNRDVPIIIIAQRLAEDDLVNHVFTEDPESWDSLIIPAYDEKLDVVAWEEKHSKSDLMLMKLKNPYLFHAQYQQKPMKIGGVVFKESWFCRYKVLPKMKRVAIFADTALKIKQENDYSVLLLAGLGQDEKVYFMDLKRGKWQSFELERALKDFYNKHKKIVSKVFVEDKASGIGLIQSIRDQASMPIFGVGVDSDKYTRAMNVQGFFEAGYCCLPEEAGWVNDYLEEMGEFSASMSHKHDDQVDVSVMAMTEFKMNDIVYLWED